MMRDLCPAAEKMAEVGRSLASATGCDAATRIPFRSEFDVTQEERLGLEGAAEQHVG